MKQFSHLMEISAALATARDVPGLVRTLAKRAHEVVPFDTCLLALHHPDKAVYSLWGSRPDDRDSGQRETAIPLSQGIAGWVIRTGERVLVDADHPLPPEMGISRVGIDDAQGVLALPLIGDRGETFGALVLTSEAAVPFSREHLPLGSVLAALAASSVRSTLRLKEFSQGDDFVFSLARAIEAKDPYTEGHGSRVAEYALALGHRAGLESAELVTLYKGGFLHDVGKIGISDAVLLKEGALTDSEYAHMKEHPEIGAQLLQAMPAADPLIPMILHHHERWDGRGYPNGLVKDEPSLMARIVAIADAFDAMTSTRCYRPAMPVVRGLEILREYQGTQWDPDLAGMFVEIVDKRLSETGAARFPLIGLV